MQSSPQASKDGTVLFACGENPYTVRDLIDAALFRGEIKPIWSELQRAVAAEKQAADLDLDFDESALDGAAEQFRYRYDLITAEETEQWLEARGLTLSDFSDFFARRYWGSTLKGKLQAAEVDYLTAPAELRDLLTTDLILSGELNGMARRLAWRVASGCAAENSDAVTVASEKQGFLQRAGINETQLPDWLGRLERDNAWLEEMLKIEALYLRQREALLTTEARARELGALRLPLTRFSVEIIELESSDAAREALLCVRDDGSSMEEVATEGRYPFRCADIVLEDIPADLQQKFLSVTPGSVLDPIDQGDGFQLWRVLDKKEPNPEDPAVRERVDQRILDRHFAELCAKHIRWRFVSSE